MNRFAYVPRLPLSHYVVVFWGYETYGAGQSEPEFRALYEAAGFTLSRLVPTPPLQTCVIEGRPS